MKIEIFLAKFKDSRVDAETGCRIWSGYFDRYGYAKYSGRGAYKIAYQTFVGDVPDGLTVDHTCFNPRCVEPSHLRLLTRAQNGRNTTARPGLVPDGECINGHTYSPNNTYTRPDGGRDCRACIRARVAAYKARRAAA